MVNKKFENLFNQKTRLPEQDLKQFHMDIAASIQDVTEKIILKLVKNLRNEYKIENLCLAGGVALNCVANGKIRKEKIFENIWIQPAAGDSGTAIGAALYYWYNELNNEKKFTAKDSMRGSFLGPSFTSNEIETQLTTLNAKFEHLDEETIISNIAKEIAEGKAIGWFNGKMEFGPRSLGSRSIIADPRNDIMQRQLNLKIKFRESFRPFAPSVLYEDLNDWFDLEIESPYMLLVSQVNKNKLIKMTEDQEKLFGIEKLNIKRSEIPAVTHVDFSARIQTVHKDTNEKYYNLIKKFKELTNCPVLLNTSFNIRGEPIVCSPEDAFRCFMGTNLDVLVIENFVLYKKDQNKDLIMDYRKNFELD